MDILREDILPKAKLQETVEYTTKKISEMKETFVLTFPSPASVNNVYAECENTEDWHQGFWTGMLWIAYELTGNKSFAETAEKQIPTFYNRIKNKIGVNHHDMGFLYTPSCVAAYKLTGNEQAKDAAVLAAEHLISRYNEKGKFIQAWGDVGENSRLIIDCLLNIPLLFWAYEVTGNKKFDEFAFEHFLTTANNIVRNDGSTYHTYFLDKESGMPIKGTTHQGASDNSCWARGQAWGIYGMMLTAKYHKNNISLQKFKAITDCFIKHLPKDYVPYWDMIYGDDSDEPRDSSAGSIAVCGILEAVKNLDRDEAEKYIVIANKIMNSLIDNYLSKKTANCNGLLLHATYALPSGIGIDECNIWGDYFFMEALIRFVTDNTWEMYW